MPQEELLIAEDFAPPSVATLQIAEAFPTPTESLTSDSKEIYHETAAETASTTTADYKVVEAEPVEPAVTGGQQSLERQTKRKMSGSSPASRTSGHSSHRSRSRSRSKERLLSKLAHSGDIKITTDEEDDIAGLKLCLCLGCVCVVYLDQQMGAPHTIRWSKSCFSSFFPFVIERNGKTCLRAEQKDFHQRRVCGAPVC